MAAEQQLEVVSPYYWNNPYTDVSPNPYTFDTSVYGGSQYYPYLVPIPIGPPQQAPPQPMKADGPTEQEVLQEKNELQKSNRDLTIAIVFLVLLFLAAIGAIVGVLLSGEGGIIGRTTTTTIVGFEVVKPAQSFGPDYTNKNSLAYINSQIDFCSMIKDDWFSAASSQITDCKVSSFASGSLKAVMEVTFKNNDKESSVILNEVKVIVLAKSLSDGRTDTVVDSTFQIVGTGTTAGAKAAAPTTLFVLLLSTMLLLHQWL